MGLWEELVHLKKKMARRLRRLKLINKTSKITKSSKRARSNNLNPKRRNRSMRMK